MQLILLWPGHTEGASSLLIMTCRVLQCILMSNRTNFARCVLKLGVLMSFPERIYGEGGGA